MNKITKKTAFGITGAAAATLLVGGLAAPAMAETAGSTLEPTTETSSEWTQAQFDALGDVGLDGGDVSNESPVVLAPEVGVGVGDIGSGNAIGSGNELNAPIASGNETAIGNNNANGTDIGANVSDIVDNSTGVTSDVSDIVDSTTDASDIVDSVDVDGMIDDVTSGLDLGGILGE